MSKPRLLFLTAPEAGQANVQIAVIASLKEKHGDAVEYHLAGFESLRRRTPEGVIFHPIVGKGILAHHSKDGTDYEGAVRTVAKPPGFFGAVQTIPLFFYTLHPETPEEYLASAFDAQKLIYEVDPDYIVADSTFNSARDAMLRSGKNFCLLTPNTFKEAAIKEQKGNALKLPAIGTGYLYPIPWYLRPLNILLIIFTAVYTFKIEKRLRIFDKARNEAGFGGRVPLFKPKTGFTVMCMSTPEAELPAIIPDWLECCGPIVMKSPPLAEVDPELDQWVKSRPTVLIVLGTHYVMNETTANEMLKSIRVLLDIRKDIQVLWKLKKTDSFGLEGLDGFKGDRLRIFEWLKADPAAILATGNVVCFVNHGGSNSYHEGLAAGVPQIIMPAWVDCYDFVSRVNYLGNGVWGNPTSAPSVSERDCTQALLRVVGRTPDAAEAVKFRARAKELAAIVTRNGTRQGRDVAADRIWEELMVEYERRK
ncbi:hypothetical protein IAU59_000939 [Kwoniella sp. CBS 9459]